MYHVGLYSLQHFMTVLCCCVLLTVLLCCCVLLTTVGNCIIQRVVSWLWFEGPGTPGCAPGVFGAPSQGGGGNCPEVEGRSSF